MPQRRQTPAQTDILGVPILSSPLISTQPWVTCETVPSSLTWTLRRSGWKSLVTIVPGAITRCFSGRSRFAKFTSLDVSSSVIFLPTSLLLHSSVLLSGALVTPGTTRGILGRFLRMLSLVVLMKSGTLMVLIVRRCLSGLRQCRVGGTVKAWNPASGGCCLSIYHCHRP